MGKGGVGLERTDIFLSHFFLVLDVVSSLRLIFALQVNRARIAMNRFVAFAVVVVSS